MSQPPPPPQQQPVAKKRDRRIFSGTCPDPSCQARLFFPAHGPLSSGSIECTDCGQRHEQRQLLGVEEVTDPDLVLHNLLRNALLGVSGGAPPRKNTELVKVMGLSNYHCKLLSPILARYGMDKQTGKAKLLSEMNQGDVFDCALLGDRAFLIEPEHVDTMGYGKDRSGSLLYLHDTLEDIKKANNSQECLIPVHVDGDGHCLVHAVSRALVGRELFWHALRENLKKHFKENLSRYKALFHDFIDAVEWEDIINECDPLFIPPEGVPLGLRNIHIFGLANVLHRPIILLDSLSGMRSSGDYSATFLPGLIPVEKCMGKDGMLNKPICIAWSSSGRNHYIPLVGIKGAALPKLPLKLLPKAWGVPQDLIRKYIKLEEDGCVIGGDRSLQDKYLLRLVAAMEEVFMNKHGIHPSLVADVHQYFYRRTGVIGVQPEDVTAAAKKAVIDNRLHKCLICGALSELHVPLEWLAPGGKLYNLAKSTHGQLRPDKNYSFPLNSLVCSYNSVKDVLVPDYNLSSLTACNWCHGTLVRRVRGDGSVVYLDGDRTNTRSTGGKCGCGFKHYWDGKEYDNLPEAFPITLEWGGRVVRETVYWFQYESDTTLNSNVYDVAMKLVTKHFPGEFGSEILVQKVVNTILHQTAKKNPDDYTPVNIDGAHVQRADDVQQGQDVESQLPTKIILTGQKMKTLHKEELNMSKTERTIQQNIADQASVMQKRKTEKLKQEQKGQPRTTSPGAIRDGPSSAPATPTKTPYSPTSTKEKKIRITTNDGRQSMLTLKSTTTFVELQESIAREFNIPPYLQCIRYGFPPKELLPPKEGLENEPVPLQHGDKITIEIFKGKVEGGSQPASAPSTHAVKHEDAAVTSKIASKELQEQVDKEMYSLCLLATLMGEDVWSYAKALPHLFQQGGVFYSIMKKTTGLADGKHCTFPYLPGKNFVYNAAEDRLELCVDAAGHFPIGPDVEDLVKEALTQVRAEATSRSREASPSHGLLKLGSGGVVKKKSEQLHNVTAFQGKGHSLGTASSSQQLDQKARETMLLRKHSTETDFSPNPAKIEPSIITSAPGNSELIRIAPGVVTMRDSRQLDPTLVEAQRKKLQEMVSSIQASMDRHLRDQNAEQSASIDLSQRKIEAVSSSPKTGSIQANLPESFSVIGGTELSNTETTAGNVVNSMGATFHTRPKAQKGNSVEEAEEMDSQDAEISNTTEPMDHS
nr:deubiquitinating protein VCIP135 [Pelodiscus sinensis]|eukprot:XP_006131535.1 deubiquitinating protein VCIP135 [Pelodiscus sinensis]